MIDLPTSQRATSSERVKDSMTAATSFFRFTHDSKKYNVDDGADHRMAWHYFLGGTFSSYHELPRAICIFFGCTR